MTKWAALALAVAFSMAPLATSLQAEQPPARPHALTAAQFDHLQKLEAASEHADVQDLHASYESERQKELEAVRLSDDVLTGIYQIGYPLGYLIVLVTAI